MYRFFIRQVNERKPFWHDTVPTTKWVQWVTRENGDQIWLDTRPQRLPRYKSTRSCTVNHAMPRLFRDTQVSRLFSAPDSQSNGNRLPANSKHLNIFKIFTACKTSTVGSLSQVELPNARICPINNKLPEYSASKRLWKRRQRPSPQKTPKRGISQRYSNLAPPTPKFDVAAADRSASSRCC